MFPDKKYYGIMEFFSPIYCKFFMCDVNYFVSFGRSHALFLRLYLFELLYFVDMHGGVPSWKLLF